MVFNAETQCLLKHKKAKKKWGKKNLIHMKFLWPRSGYIFFRADPGYGFASNLNGSFIVLTSFCVLLVEFQTILYCMYIRFRGIIVFCH